MPAHLILTELLVGTMRAEALERIPDLWKATYDLVAQVPEGRVTTYGEVAKALGDILASRFVGLAMSRNDDIVRVPCRRVVQSDGGIGGYTGGGPRKKMRLLREEGIQIKGDKVLDLEGVLFDDFRTSYPLRELKKRQLMLKRHLRTSEFKPPIDAVAGVDVAYQDQHAYAAMVMLDYRTGEEMERRVVEGDARFPYVPSYLAFREIPLIRPLMRDLGKRTIVMYDGNGTIHPEEFGIASQVGVTFNRPTIGVAKKLLCGEVRGEPGRPARRITLNGKTIGHAYSKGGVGKPVFVSVGHGVSQDQALEIASRFTKHRIPEPTRLAHITAEEARRGTSHK